MPLGGLHGLSRGSDKPLGAHMGHSEVYLGHLEVCMGHLEVHNSWSNKFRNEYCCHFLATIKEEIQLHIVLKSEHLSNIIHRKCKSVKS